MNYKNGKEVLPPSLLKEVQKYIHGAIIYVPKKKSERAAWGELSGSRQMIKERNEEISILYAEGWSVRQLERKFHLSKESIRKIVVKDKRFHRPSFGE